MEIWAEVNRTFKSGVTKLNKSNYIMLKSNLNHKLYIFTRLKEVGYLGGKKEILAEAVIESHVFFYFLSKQKT